jgi:hypothetical protein
MTKDADDGSQVTPLGKLSADTLSLLTDLHLADQHLAKHPQYAVLLSVIALYNFLIHAGCHRRDLGFAPQNSHLPGEAVRHLVVALTDLTKGMVDPVLKPTTAEGTKLEPHTLPLTVQLERVHLVVWAELLMMDGYSVRDAARKVAELAKGDPLLASVKTPWRAIMRWRTVIKSGGADAWDAGTFNALVAAAKHTVEARGGTSADYGWLAARILKASKSTE